MKKLYNLKINNKGIILKEDTADIGVEKFTGMAGAVKDVAGMATNLASDITNIMTYFAASTLSLFADEETKKRIEEKYKDRRRKIKNKYSSILDNVKSTDSEFAVAMFSPSLAVFEKATEDLKDKGGIVGENLADFLDDPFTYITQIYPKIKENITGKIEDKVKEKKEDKQSNADLDRILKKIKAIGIENLEPLTKKETSNLNYEKRQVLIGIIDYYKKNKERISDNRNYTLNVSKRLIIEVKEDIKNLPKYLDEYQKAVNKLTLSYIKQMTEDSNLEEDYKIYAQDVKTYINSCYDASKFCAFMVEFMEKVKFVIDSNNDESIKQLSNFYSSSSLRVKDQKVDKSLKEFFNIFKDVKSIDQLKQSVKSKEFLSAVQQVGQKLQEAMKFLSEESVKSFTDLKDNIELKEKLEEVSRNSKDTINSLSNLYNYFKQVKLDNDSK